MDENVNKYPEGEASGITGLEFEIGSTAGEQLVFEEISDSSESPAVVEIDLSGLPKEQPEEKPVKPEEPLIPEEEFSFDGFIEDRPLFAPTYVPRFTEASENYRMNYVSRTRSNLPTKEEHPKDNVDPTAEIDENTHTPHVVVTPTAPVDPILKDETITILKFDEEENASPEIDREELEVRELQEVVMDAVRSDEPTEEEPVIEEPLCAPAEPEAEPLTPQLPDPFVDVTLVDYNAEDDDSESLSSEDAPSAISSKSRRSEFGKPSDADRVKDSFLDKLMSVRIRLIAASCLLALMLTIDVLALFSIDLFELIGISSAPYTAAFVDLQCSICLFLFALPEFIRSVGNLTHKIFSPELVMAPSLIAVVLNSVATITASSPDYVGYGVLFAIQAVLAILGSYFRVRADFTAFKVISKNQEKRVLDKRLTRTLPRENLALDGAIDEYRSKIARMFRTAFISDFSKRSSAAVENSFNNILMLLSSLGISLVTAIVMLVLDGGSFTAFSGTFAFVFLVSFPAFSMLIHKLPHLYCSGEADLENSAFVGEASLYSCSDIDVVAYDDTEIFGTEAVSIKKVHLYGKSYNASKAMEDMHALFSVVGGPLAPIFDEAVGGVGASAINVVIDDDGISGTLAGRTVRAGTLEYMQRNGITVPDDDYKTNPTGSDSTKVMYGADGDGVYVKFFIRYSFSEEFTMLLPGLKSEGIVPLIYTRDPNLTADFFRILTLGEDIIRVMKKHTIPADEKVYRRVSAGIVTLGGKLDAINMVLLAKKYTSFQSGLSVSELISMLAGCALAVIFAISGSLSIPVVALSALQLGWCAYLFIRTAHTFKNKKHKGKE
ncbi:MAG: hypothetical protein IKC32_05910 [Clostridia bacterium]|nr:hypothetical protein [Clostridia bacterium]